jgi:uncharacterized membrane protein
MPVWRRALNIVIGAVLSFYAAFGLSALSVPLIGVDVGYSELSRDSKIVVWVIRVIAVLIGLTLFAWVVRKNISINT